MPVPLVFMRVPQASCLRTMEQTFINLLTPELNAPWVRRLVTSKHSHGTRTDPVRAVRRQLVSRRQFKRYLRKARRLSLVQPSVFRSPKVVTATVYALRLMFDLGSDWLKSFLAQKFLRSNYVGADMVYHLYRVASHLGDPYFETLRRPKLTGALRFRQLPVPRPCVPLSMLMRLPQHNFARMVRSALDQCLSISEDRLIPNHIPTTRIIPASHPKIEDVLYSHMDVVQSWTADVTAQQMGWTCPCATIVARHPEVQLVDGHVVCSASLLLLSDDLKELAASSANNAVYPLKGGAWASFHQAATKWTQDHGLLCLPADDLWNLWEPAWTQHENNLDDKWTVSDVLRLKDYASGLVWHVRDHEGSHSQAFRPVKYWKMLDNTYLTANIFQPLSMHAGCAFTQVEQAVPDDILKHFSIGFQFRRRGTGGPWSYILPKHKKALKAGRPIVAFSAHPAKKFLAALARVLDGLVSRVCPHAAPYNDALDKWQSLHVFLDRLVGLSELDGEVTLHNQDLAGFFVSIPLHRFLQAFKLLLCKAYDLRECDLREGLHGVYVTVDLTNATTPMRLFRGRYCSPIRMDLFMMAVELSFKFSLFTVGRQVVRQSRGAPMGSPFSPSVRHAAISFFEHQYFSRVLLSPIMSSGQCWVGRYVDNRLTLLSSMLEKLPVFAAFLHQEIRPTGAVGVWGW